MVVHNPGCGISWKHACMQSLTVCDMALQGIRRMCNALWGAQVWLLAAASHGAAQGVLVLVCCYV
jgi:hypothetical protein